MRVRFPIGTRFRATVTVSQKHRKATGKPYGVVYLSAKDIEVIVRSIPDPGPRAKAKPGTGSGRAFTYVMEYHPSAPLDGLRPMNRRCTPIRVVELYKRLIHQEPTEFPDSGWPDAPDASGVYIIRNRRKQVLHVGDTPRGKRGIKQRLKNHLQGKSSFARNYLETHKTVALRRGCSFQYLVVKSAYQRRALEYYAIGRLCPRHLGCG